MKTHSHLPSITKILRETLPEEKRLALEAWRQRIGEEEAERIRQEAMARGRNYDDQVQRFMNGEEIEHKGLAKFLTEFKVVSAEQVIVNNILGYQGRYDAIAERQTSFKTERVLIDFKGAAKKKERKHIQDEMLQLTSYWLALEQMKEPIHYAMLVYILPYDEIQLRELYIDKRNILGKELETRVSEYYEVTGLDMFALTKSDE